MPKKEVGSNIKEWTALVDVGEPIDVEILYITAA